MAEEQDLNSASPDEIRQQIEETRASLNHKLDALEGEVRCTVAEAKVSVKQTLSLRYHADVRPWTVFGASVLTGMLLGAAVVRSKEPVQQAGTNIQNWLHRQRSEIRHNGGHNIARKINDGVGGVIGEAREEVRRQADELRSAALATVAGLAGEVTRRSVPGPLGTRLASIVDHIAQNAAARVQ